MKFIGVTSCATGIAHSYMAAEALENIAKELDFDFKIEIQGALGIENRIDKKDLEDTKVIVFANDVNITDVDRFENFEEKIIRTSPHDAIRHPETIKNKVLESLNNS